jgi:hypothetical protein
MSVLILYCFLFNIFFSKKIKIIKIKSNLKQLTIRKIFEIREIQRYIGINKLIFFIKTGKLID